MILLNREGRKLVRKSVRILFCLSIGGHRLNLRILNSDLVAYAESFAYNLMFGLTVIEGSIPRM